MNSVMPTLLPLATSTYTSARVCFSSVLSVVFVRLLPASVQRWCHHAYQLYQQHAEVIGVKSIRYAQPFAVLFVWFILAFCCWIWRWHLLPNVGSELRSSWWMTIQNAGVWYLFFSMYWFHLNAVYRGSRNILNHHPTAYPPLLDEDERTRAVEGGAKVCKHCLHIKPPRVHHCKVCNVCVMRMDHHVSTHQHQHPHHNGWQSSNDAMPCWAQLNTIMTIWVMIVNVSVIGEALRGEQFVCE